MKDDLDRFHEEQMQDPEYARAYARAQEQDVRPAFNRRINQILGEIDSCLSEHGAQTKGPE